MCHGNEYLLVYFPIELHIEYKEQVESNYKIN